MPAHLPYAYAMQRACPTSITYLLACLPASWPSSAAVEWGAACTGQGVKPSGERSGDSLRFGPCSTRLHGNSNKWPNSQHITTPAPGSAQRLRPPVQEAFAAAAAAPLLP